MAEKLKGGLADNKTVEEIARKHSVFIGTIKKALEKGMKVESEHTSDIELQEEIAKDHLWEDAEYYDKLEKMEKKETKEQTDASSSGSFEAPAFGGGVIQKRIFQEMIRNAKKSLNEMDGIPAMAVDGPIGTKSPSTPMHKGKHHKVTQKDVLALDEKSKTASITAASTKDMISTKKGFPRFGGPEAKFVEINAKCKKFPYCNQGDYKGDNKFKFINEIHGMKDAIESAAKKYNLPFEEVAKIIMKEAYELPKGIDMSPTKTWGKTGQEKIFLYQLTTIDPETKEPTPLIFKTKNESDIAKLKILLSGQGIMFHEEKQPISGEEIKDIPKDDDDDVDDIYGSDDELNTEDDIFINYKK
jgi:hypothetical protein